MAASSAKTTTRATLDLDTDVHRQLKRFALDQADNAPLMHVLQAAVTVLLRDESVANKVLLELHRSRG